MLLMIAGCGQKGPLYIPGDPSRIQTTVPAGSSDGSQQEDDEREEDRDDDSGRQS